jgi:hypothetical protein
VGVSGRTTAGSVRLVTFVQAMLLVGIFMVLLVVAVGVLGVLDGGLGPGRFLELLVGAVLYLVIVTPAAYLRWRSFESRPERD